jgi:hypothetical protein
MFCTVYADADIIMYEKIKKADTSIDSVFVHTNKKRIHTNKSVELYRKNGNSNIYNLFYPIIKKDTIYLIKARVAIPRFFQYQYTKLTNNNNVQIIFCKKGEKYIISINNEELKYFEEFYEKEENENSNKIQVQHLFYIREEMSMDYMCLTKEINNIYIFVKLLKKRSREQKEKLAQSLNNFHTIDSRIITMSTD